MSEIVLGGLRPNPKQIQFFESTARYTAYGGSLGGGKSWAMRRKLVLLCLNYSGLKTLLLRRTFDELEGNHIRPLRVELEGIAKYNADKHIFTFPNGSILQLGYCDKEGDVYRYQGQEYDVIGFEEATLFTEYQMEFLETRNRTTRSDFSPRCYYTCNPGGPGHDRIKRLFIDKVYDEERGENPDDYKFIKATVYDNEVLMKNDPTYAKRLERLPEHLRRAFLLGDWDVVEGQFFKEFNREKHVIEPFPLSRDWKRFRSIDIGFNDPTCVLWYAIAPDSRIYVYKELYVVPRSTTDLARMIKERDKNDAIQYMVGSVDMWNKHGSKDVLGGECVAETLAKLKVPVRKADNNRMNGWARIREMLMDAPDGKPYLQIFSTCNNLIRTLPTLYYDKNDHEDVDSHCDDHCAESMRYALLSRPSPTRYIEKKINNRYGYDPLELAPKQRSDGFFYQH